MLHFPNLRNHLVFYAAFAREAFQGRVIHNALTKVASQNLVADFCCELTSSICDAVLLVKSEWLMSFV
jgi:hypothetical protein